MNDLSPDRGAALILALMMLAFLSLLGGALLASVTLNVRIGDNYRVGTQLLHLAETGIEDARESLRISAATAPELLAVAAGPDGVLSTSADLDEILSATDDVPYLNGETRTAGRTFTDSSGRLAGRYFVFLRNDPAEGVQNTADSNRVLRFLSVGVIGPARRALEATVAPGGFPRVPAPLVLNGSPAVLAPPDAFFLTATPPLSADEIEQTLDPRLKTPAAMERLIEKIQAKATDVYDPGWSGETVLQNFGAANNFRVGVVNGDCKLGPGAGYGLLVVRGDLTVEGNLYWEGLIAVIGQGSLRWTNGASGQVAGAIVLARTHESDRGPGAPLGTMRSARGPVTADFSGAGPITLRLDAGRLDAANRRFPYRVVAYREY